MNLFSRVLLYATTVSVFFARLMHAVVYNPVAIGLVALRAFLV